MATHISELSLRMQRLDPIFITMQKRAGKKIGSRVLYKAAHSWFC